MSDIRERVQAFVNELGDLVRKAAVESVQEALGARSALRRGPGRPSTAGRGRARSRPKGQKRSARQLEALTGRLLAKIGKAPGSRIEPIAEAMGVSTKDLMLPTRKLLASGAIRKKGVKRSTQYFLK